jgi:hypothetical protein
MYSKHTSTPLRGMKLMSLDYKHPSTYLVRTLGLLLFPPLMGMHFLAITIEGEG